MELNDFLVLAKKSTYAGSGVENILEDGSKELTFESDGYKYRDRYFGSRAFCGEEIVFKNNKPIWSMNYYGQTQSDTIGIEDITKFLKASLSKITPDMPFRGPVMNSILGFYYVTKVVGDINFFYGEERIFFKNKEVHKLEYHGGKIEK